MAEAPRLAVGGTAYIRANTVQGAGRWCSFGQVVKLESVREGPPRVWLVSATRKRARVPEYCLTPSREEIDVLRTHNRIPKLISYAFEGKDGWECITGEQLVYSGKQPFGVITGQSMALAEPPDGRSPFAIKGMCVAVDPALRSMNSERAALSRPPLLFDRNKKPFVVDPSSLYYCVGDGKHTAFERITRDRVEALAESGPGGRTL